jgi:hypothetical protein
VTHDAPLRAYEDASDKEHEELAGLAERLGFTDVRIMYRDTGISPLIYARWRGAPVALSLRSGLAGGFSCAFYRGVQEVEVDEDGESWSRGEWDEVVDSSCGSPEVALVMGAALLEAFSEGREEAYRLVEAALLLRRKDADPAAEGNQ